MKANRVHTALSVATLQGSTVPFIKFALYMTTTTAQNMVVHTTQEALNHSKVGQFCLLYEVLLLNVSDVTKTAVNDSGLLGKVML